MKERIEDNKFVELTYRVIDQNTGEVLTAIEFPLGYVQGRNEVLAPQIMAELEGKTTGDTMRVQIFFLVITDAIENVPEEYREIGTRIVMENDRGQTKDFLVTRLDDKTLTIDGNHPLCGRKVFFELVVLSVRDATHEEIVAGGKVERGPDLGGVQVRPI